MGLPFPILTADEAADMIQNGQIIGFSGFTAAGAAKAVPFALAQKARREHEAGRPFKVGVLTGASTGKSLDGALAEAEAINFRAPYQGNPTLRKQINAGKVRFVDMHLSVVAQQVRYGFLGKISWAVVEACDVTAGGGIVLSTSVGNSNTYLRVADKVIIELNSKHPTSLLGIHDIFEPKDPPGRSEIPILSPSDRCGSPICVVDPDKIAGVVFTNLADESGGFEEGTPVTDQIGQNVADFLVSEIRTGRVPSSFLPLQSGVGNIANAVLAALGRSSEIPAFEMYTEVLQDSVIPLLENGRCKFASTCSLTLSAEAMSKVVADMSYYKKRLVLRPQEISNNPEVARRLGLIAMNTALEADIFGNVNSTHVLGTKMMNGIGGSGDFTRSAMLSIFTTPSTAKDGKISSFVPMVSHLDHSEHSVKIIITEYGVADLRGKSPIQRARCIIDNCVHPDYRPLLNEYLEMGIKGQTPQNLKCCFAFHEEFAKSGDMHNVKWEEYNK